MRRFALSGGLFGGLFGGLVGALVGALVACLPLAASAHTGALAACELKVLGHTVVMGWSADDFAPQGGLAAPTLDGCEATAARQWRCPAGLEGVAVVADELAGRDGQIVVTVERGGATARGMLDPRRTRWEIPASKEEGQARGGAFLRYLEEGVRHIAVGIDHLVFVLGLLLLVPAARSLVGVITAFTLGHSVTLAVSTTTGLAPASAPTEALIAGSILLLARELVVSGREGREGRHPAGLAFVFGLAHGFGFSGALAEVGVPPGELAGALLGFNLGVEVGQLVFVGLLVASAWVLVQVSPRGLGWLRRWTPWGIGAVAAFWFVERMVGLG